MCSVHLAAGAGAGLPGEARGGRRDHRALGPPRGAGRSRGHRAPAGESVSICTALHRAGLCILEAADRGSFHGDEWVFSSALLPSYEKGDRVRRRLYEAIKNVCHFRLGNVTGKRGKEKGKKKNKTLQNRQGNKAVFTARNGSLSAAIRGLGMGHGSTQDPGLWAA